MTLPIEVVTVLGVLAVIGVIAIVGVVWFVGEQFKGDDDDYYGG